MPKSVSGNTAATAKARLIRHRGRQEQRGLRRLELTVPAQDAMLLGQLARILRTMGDEADRLRHFLDDVTSGDKSLTGADFVTLLKGSKPFDINPYIEPREVGRERADPFD